MSNTVPDDILGSLIVDLRDKTNETFGGGFSVTGIRVIRAQRPTPAYVELSLRYSSLNDKNWRENSAILIDLHVIAKLLEMVGADWQSLCDGPAGRKGPFKVT